MCPSVLLAEEGGIKSDLQKVIHPAASVFLFTKGEHVYLSSDLFSIAQIPRLAKAHLHLDEKYPKHTLKPSACSVDILPFGCPAMGLSDIVLKLH